MANAFETGAADYIAKALGLVARAKGMKEISKKGFPVNCSIGFSVSANPTLKTTLAVLRVLGVDMTAKPHTVA